MDRKKRIGINGLFLRKPGTGIGQVTQFFLSELTHVKGDDLDYMIYVDDPTIKFSLGDQGKVIYIRPWWKRDDRIRKLLWEHIQLPKQALKDEVTHFLSLYQAPTEFPKSIRHVMMVHDLIPEVFPEYISNTRSRFIWNLTKRAIKKATSIVTVSQSTKRDVQKYLGVEETNITISYPSINPLFFEAVSPEKATEVLNRYSLEPGYLYHGGGLEIRKNTESVLASYAAWRSTAANPNALPPLVISGTIHDQGNPLATDVRSLISRLSLEDSVKLLGFVPDQDLPALYKEARLFIFPSRYEGFGMPVVEALSQGTAVIAFRNSSLGEVGGEVVFWTEELTKENLEASYQKALQSSDEEKGIRRLQAEGFRSWGNFAQKIIDTLIQ